MNKVGRIGCSILLRCAGLIVPLLLCAVSLMAAGQPVLQEIIIHGQRRIPAETVRARMASRAGDAYDAGTLERDFNSLWNTGYFEDIRMEREDTEKGWILHVYVTEKPVISELKYVGVNSVSISDILDRFKERKVSLTQQSQYDPTAVKHAEVVIKQLLAEHGRQFAVVRTEVRRIPPASVGITFVVKEGPKVKVGNIHFKGNSKLPSGYLRAAMKNLRPVGVPHSIFLENIFSKTYDASKLEEDAERVRIAYQDKGYFKVVVSDPQTTMRDYRPGLVHVPLIQKPGKRVDLTVPIEEGERYTLKGITFTGNKAITNTKFLRSLIQLQDGAIFNRTAISKGLENLRKAYGELGYINFTPVPDTEIDDEKKEVALKIDIDEGKPFYVRRIEFVGNTTTRDKVIRRELALEEGNVYNRRLWELSLLRLNQLGYFEALKAEGPDADQSTDIKQNNQEGTVDITLKVKEKGKNSIGLTGGVSGLAGSFVGINYETNNFLGLGDTLRFEADTGSRQRNFLIGFTEPYLFDRSITAGFTLFNTEYKYNEEQELSILANQQLSMNPATEQNYTQNSKGFTIFASHPLKRSFTRIGITYSYSVTDIDAQTNAAEVLFQTLQYRSLSGPSALRGIRSSKVTPTIQYNTIDNPMNPTHGKSFAYSLDFEGLGGNAKSVTQMFETKYFHTVNKRNVLGFRLQSAFTTGYGGLGVSPYNRFYTGGDDSIRGFDIRSISPIAFIPVVSNTSISYTDPNQLGSSGSPITRTVGLPILSYTIVYPGGDTQLLGNAEYRIPIAGPVSMALFFDAGLNGILRRSELKLDSAGLEQMQGQFPNANLSNSLQLLPGTNFAPRTSTGVEIVVQLPIVQAPLRVYWAFNPNRYAQTVTAPASLYYLSDAYRNSLPPGVYEQQIEPIMNNYLQNQQQVEFREKRSTFRFTVSRTF